MRRVAVCTSSLLYAALRSDALAWKPKPTAGEIRAAEEGGWRTARRREGPKAQRRRMAQVLGGEAARPTRMTKTSATRTTTTTKTTNGPTAVQTARADAERTTTGSDAGDQNDDLADGDSC